MYRCVTGINVNIKHDASSCRRVLVARREKNGIIEGLYAKGPM